MKILCLIIDSTPQAAWRETYEAHRRRWHRCLDVSPDVNGYFLRSDPTLDADHVCTGRSFTVRGNEDLDTILHKTRVAIEVLLADHDYVVRTNLSSIYDFPLLQRTALPREDVYAGHVIHAEGCRFVSGSGMILSRDVAKKLLSPVTTVLKPYDDVAICQILDEQGVRPHPLAMYSYLYGRGLDQISVGQHIQYRVKDADDPTRSREREVGDYVFSQIYGDPDCVT